LRCSGSIIRNPDAPAEPSQYDLLQAWPNIDYIIGVRWFAPPLPMSP
jgi:hypothetical protein